MLQAAASFSAGVLVVQGLETCQNAISDCAVDACGENEDTAFKLAVHVHAASALDLCEPGFMARPRLRVHVFLGNMQKETEVADFACVADRATKFQQQQPASSSNARIKV